MNAMDPHIYSRNWRIPFFSADCFSHAIQVSDILFLQERMMQLQESPKGLNAGRETSEREQALEAQLVEARSIISEQVLVDLVLTMLTRTVSWKTE
jgi:hypothetical protein